MESIEQTNWITDTSDVCGGSPMKSSSQIATVELEDKSGQQADTRAEVANTSL